MIGVPTNKDVTDIKPIMRGVKNVFPNMGDITFSTQVYIDAGTIPFGQWLPFAGFTYPTAQSFNKPRS